MFREIAILIFLTLIRGVEGMSDLAMHPARPKRLKLIAGKGSRGAATALRLSADPAGFLFSASDRNETGRRSGGCVFWRDVGHVMDRDLYGGGPFIHRPSRNRSVSGQSWWRSPITFWSWAGSC